MISSNKTLRHDYNTTIPRIMDLVNVKEINNENIPKILWRLMTFHEKKYLDLMFKKKSIANWLGQFVGYHMHGVQAKSNAAYVRKMTKR